MSMHARAGILELTPWATDLRRRPGRVKRAGRLALLLGLGILGVWLVSGLGAGAPVAASDAMASRQQGIALPGPVAGSSGIVSGSVRVTNVTDQGFTVSWLTTDAVTGAVRYGTSPDSLLGLAAEDDPAARRTHHVTVGAEPPYVQADTLYYLDLLSGNQVDDNGGVHYLYMTAPVLPPAVRENVWGTIITGSGVPVSGSLVYLTVADADAVGSPGTSSPQSILADAAGIWAFNLGNLREGDLTHAFAYSSTTDIIRVEVQGNPDGLGYDAFTADLGFSRTITLTAGMLPPPPAPSPVPGGPDLVVEGIAVQPPTPKPGCPMSVTVTVRNISDSESVTVPFRVALYVDHSRVPYPGERSNTNTYWTVTQTLAPSGSLTLSSLETVAASGVISRLMAAGSHALYAQVDSYNNQVAELNEDNNIYGPVYLSVEGICTWYVYLPIVLRTP